MRAQSSLQDFKAKEIAGVPHVQRPCLVCKERVWFSVQRATKRPDALICDNCFDGRTLRLDLVEGFRVVPKSALIS